MDEKGVSTLAGAGCPLISGFMAIILLSPHRNQQNNATGTGT
jgi:hypothetical protein